MKWYKNLKTTPKLLLGFGVVIVLAIVLSTVAYTSMGSIDDQYSGIIDNDLPGVYYMGEVSTFIARERADLRGMLIEVSANNPDGVQDMLSSLQDNRANVETNVALYQATLAGEDEADQKRFSDADVLYKAYIANSASFISACQEMDLETANAELRAMATEIANVQTAIANMVDYRMENAQKENVEATAEAGQSQNTLLLVVGVILVVSVLIAVYIATVISKPLRAVAENARLISMGDSSVKKLNLHTKDETGQVADALDNVIDTIDMLVRDINAAVDKSLAGQLSYRADASKHQGAFEAMVKGINDILDAVIAPVQEAADALEQMSQGNLEVVVQGDYKGDHAMIKNSVNETVANIKGYISEIDRSLGAMAGGNFNTAITSDFKGNFVALKDAINMIADSLSDVMAGINTAAEQVSAGTQQVSDGAQNVSQGATEQASSIQELTATITEIAEQTRQNALNATETNQQAIVARQYAQEGNEQMKALQAAMAEINEASANISKIVKEIDNIAFQTNILALNAAVEAAHAGAYGKGFAVVAEEVRSLADKSASAAKDTTTLIEDSIQKTQMGTKIANETAESLEKIVDSVTKAGEVIGQIAQASNEQASGIAQVNKGIEQMSQVVQTNSATAEESAASAEELSGQAELLKQMVSRFELKTGNQLPPSGGYTNRGAKTDFPPKQVKASYGDEEKVKIILNDSEFGKY